MCFVRVRDLGLSFAVSFSASASLSGSVFFCSSGRMMALSCAPSVRRGRVARDRVVARRRWLQNWQCWVWIGRWVVILFFLLSSCSFWTCGVSGGNWRCDVMRLLQGNTVLVLLYVCEWQASTTSPSNSVDFDEFSVLVEWMDLRWAWTGETGVDVSHWNWRIESDLQIEQCPRKMRKIRAGCTVKSKWRGGRKCRISRR